MSIQHKIVFFDGFCNLCNFAVSTLIKLDKKRLLRFSPLSGKTSQELNISARINEADSLVYLNDTHISIKSSAVLSILKDLYPALRPLIFILNLIPNFIGDLIYDIVAKYRYRIFGKTDKCRLPSEAEKNLFLP